MTYNNLFDGIIESTKTDSRLICKIMDVKSKDLSCFSCPLQEKCDAQNNTEFLKTVTNYMKQKKIKEILK